MKFRDEKMAVSQKTIKGAADLKSVRWKELVRHNLEKAEQGAQHSVASDFIFDTALLSIGYLGPVMLAASPLATSMLSSTRTKARPVAFTTISCLRPSEMTWIRLRWCTTCLMDGNGRKNSDIIGVQKTKTPPTTWSGDIHSTMRLWHGRPEIQKTERRQVLCEKLTITSGKRAECISGQAWFRQSLSTCLYLLEKKVRSEVTVYVPDPLVSEERYDAKRQPI